MSIPFLHCVYFPCICLASMAQPLLKIRVTDTFILKTEINRLLLLISPLQEKGLWVSFHRFDAIIMCLWIAPVYYVLLFNSQTQPWTVCLLPISKAYTSVELKWLYFLSLQKSSAVLITILKMWTHFGVLNLHLNDSLLQWAVNVWYTGNNGI